MIPIYLFFIVVGIIIFAIFCLVKCCNGEKPTEESRSTESPEPGLDLESTVLEPDSVDKLLEDHREELEKIEKFLGELEINTINTLATQFDIIRVDFSYRGPALRPAPFIFPVETVMYLIKGSSDTLYRILPKDVDRLLDIGFSVSHTHYMNPRSFYLYPDFNEMAYVSKEALEDLLTRKREHVLVGTKKAKKAAQGRATSRAIRSKRKSNHTN